MMYMSGENSEFWDRVATRYDRGTDTAKYRVMTGRVARDMNGAARVLDVATGTGSVAEALAENGCTVIGVDFSEVMLARARRRCPSGCFVLQNACELDFAPESFDALVCANALHCMSRPEMAVAGFYRVLKPGGLLVVPTYCHGAHLKSRMFSRLIGLTGFRVRHRFTPRDLRELVENAGFTVTCLDLSEDTIPMAYVRAVKPETEPETAG